MLRTSTLRQLLFVDMHLFLLIYAVQIAWTSRGRLVYGLRRLQDLAQHSCRPIAILMFPLSPCVHHGFRIRHEKVHDPSPREKKAERRGE